MEDFNSKAQDWDKNKMHMERSVAIASELEKMVPLNQSMKALEYGAGTGILSFLLKDRLSEITLMDSSKEMIRICNEKVANFKIKHIKPLWFDLEYDSFNQQFDIIYNQMVLHHVNDVEPMLYKFHTMLNSNGYLAIADLYPEDGSFHGPDIKVHWGFDPMKLTEVLEKIGFKNAEHRTCYIMKPGSEKSYPIFLLVAQK